MSALRKASREPLLHFAVIGAAIFAVDAATAAEPTQQARVPATERRLVVDDAIRAELAARFAERAGQPPTDAELEALVSDWVDEELLYREGLIHGLDQDDPQVRARVAASMAQVLRAGLPRAAPTEAELRAFFDEAPERWARPARIDFTHVFVAAGTEDPEARADALLERLRGGASPDGLGDTFSGGRRYRGRRPSALAETFGASFADGLMDQAPGAWVRRRSRFGLHLVRVDRVVEARPADFEAARLDVLRAWERARERRELGRVTEELRGRWTIVDG